jgi:hypothetical protein
VAWPLDPMRLIWRALRSRRTSQCRRQSTTGGRRSVCPVLGAGPVGATAWRVPVQAGSSRARPVAEHRLLLSPSADTAIRGLRGGAAVAWDRSEAELNAHAVMPATIACPPSTTTAGRPTAASAWPLEGKISPPGSSRRSRSRGRAVSVRRARRGKSRSDRRAILRRSRRDDAARRGITRELADVEKELAPYDELVERRERREPRTGRTRRRRGHKEARPLGADRRIRRPAPRSDARRDRRRTRDPRSQRARAPRAQRGDRVRAPRRRVARDRGVGGAAPG